MTSSPPRHRALLLLAGAAGLTLLTACGSTAPADAVEQQIVSQLGAVTADCPDDLDGTVGATLTCGATDAAGPFDVTVTVTALDGGDIEFDMERVAAGDDVVDGSEVAQAVFDQLTTTVGSEPDEVSCPDLPAAVGATVRCDLTAGPDTFGVSVTTTSVDGGQVAFDITVDETSTS
jgi:hypothetical protein